MVVANCAGEDDFTPRHFDLPAEPAPNHPHLYRGVYRDNAESVANAITLEKTAKFFGYTSEGVGVLGACAQLILTNSPNLANFLRL